MDAFSIADVAWRVGWGFGVAGADEDCVEGLLEVAGHQLCIGVSRVVGRMVTELNICTLGRKYQPANERISVDMVALWNWFDQVECQDMMYCSRFKSLRITWTIVTPYLETGGEHMSLHKVLSLPNTVQ